MKNHLIIVSSILLLLYCFACQLSSKLPLDAQLAPLSAAGPHTRVVFNQPVDLRYAWLGNDAEVVIFEDEIIELIRSATSTIDVSTMTFSKWNIAEALASQAAAGLQVRIIGADFRRWQPGFWRSVAGGAEVIDNNFPALVHRISFQASTKAPDGWLIDLGQEFGPKPGGTSFGWRKDRMVNVLDQGFYPNPVLDGSFVQRNSKGACFWEIEVPNGYYYIHLMVGLADTTLRSNTFIHVEGAPVFFTFQPGYLDAFETNVFPDHADLFKGCSVDTDLAKRIRVKDGRLSVQVADPDISSFSSLCYIEIYRADQVKKAGDRCHADGKEGGTDDEVQARQLQHTKYIISDRHSPKPILWASSTNLTRSMDVTANSEDAIISTHPGLCRTFSDHFNQNWGSNTLAPDPIHSNFGTCKTPIDKLDHTIDGFDWKVRFSPSVKGAGGYDMVDNVRDFINDSNNDLILALELFLDSRGYNKFSSPWSLWNKVIPRKLAAPSYQLYAIGGQKFDTQPWNAFSNATVIFAPISSDIPGIHHKYAISDALDDTRFTRNGKLLAGSMNWSQGGFHINDEQTLFIENPYIANQYLQNSMQRLADHGGVPHRNADIVLILDKHSSMNERTHTGGETKLAAAKRATNLFLDLVDQGGAQHLCLIHSGETTAASGQLSSLEAFTPEQAAALCKHMDRITTPASGGNATAYGSALEEARTQLAASTSGNPRQIIHLLTDSQENTAPFAHTVYPDLATMGVTIHCTGFGKNVSSTVLEEMAETSGGTYQQIPSDPMELSKRFAEAAREVMSLTTIMDTRINWKTGTPSRQSIRIDEQCSKIQFLLLTDQPKDKFLPPTITAPDGQVLKSGMPGVQFHSQPGYLLIFVHKTETTPMQFNGNWLIDFQSMYSNSPSGINLLVYADSDILLQAEAIPLLFKKRQHAVLLGRLLEHGQPVINNNIKVHLQYPQQNDRKQDPKPVVLHDDGKHFDGKAGDGLFGALLPGLKAGNYHLHFISTATTSDNKAVRRDARVYYNLESRR